MTPLALSARDFAWLDGGTTILYRAVFTSDRSGSAGPLCETAEEAQQNLDEQITWWKSANPDDPITQAGVIKVTTVVAMEVLP